MHFKNPSAGKYTKTEITLKGSTYICYLKIVQYFPFEIFNKELFVLYPSCNSQNTNLLPTKIHRTIKPQKTF